MPLQRIPLILGAVFADPQGPGAGPWEIKTPEAVGLSTEALQLASDYMFRQGVIYDGPDYQRDCVLVVKDGYLVYEQYSSETYKNSKHQAYSMTKTLGALVSGYAATHSGLDIDADVTATYGVASPKSYPVTSRQIMSQSLGGSSGPGQKWSYDAAGSKWINDMTKVILAASGQKPSQIWSTMQTQLGTNISWSNVNSVFAYGSSGTCRDYARVGQLMLNKGAWKGLGEPMVSAEYIKALSTPETEYAPYTTYTNPCYGLLTWLTNIGKEDAEYPGQCQMFGTASKNSTFPAGSPSDVFYADGMYGQVIMVIPSHNAVVMSMGNSKKGSGEYRVPGDMYRGLCLGNVFGDACDVDMHTFV